MKRHVHLMTFMTDRRAARVVLRLLSVYGLENIFLIERMKEHRMVYGVLH